MSKAGHRGRRRWFLVLAVVISLVGSLLAAEFIARKALGMKPADLSVEGLPWIQIKPEGLRLRPGSGHDITARINGRRLRLSINSLGFRGPELATPRPPGAFRIMFLGDSVVFGPGLSDAETVPSRLAAILGGKVEVINAAVPGMGLADEVDLLAEKIDAVAPDLVLLGFYENDPARSIVLVEQYGDLGDGAVRLIIRARRASALFNSLWEAWLAHRIKSRRPMSDAWVSMFRGRQWVYDRAEYDRIVALSGDDFGAAWQEDSWKAMAQQLDRLQAVSLARDAPLAVVIFPVSIQVESAVADDRPQQHLMALASERMIPALDLIPDLKPAKDQDLFYDQCHLTPHGADLAAQAIARFLKQQKLAP